ncbi:MAG: hypothetical protein MOGMAGMI_01607 [Candidatus Omnitrophica bacterium]|nr:hypothetical protein [Candidatus Omnitrophota bacterium]
MGNRPAAVRVLRAAGWIIVNLITAALLTEAVLWLFFPLPPPEKYHRILRQDLPGLKARVLYETNDLGFRSLSMRSARKPERTLRIFALGASTTMQINQDTADIWSAVIERRLNERFGPSGWRIEVAAWGTGGDRVFTRARFVREKLPEYDADLVITLEGINDLCWNGGPGYSYPGPEARIHALGAKDRKLSKRFKRLKGRYSQIYRRLRRMQDQREIEASLKSGRMIRYDTDSLKGNTRNYAQLPYAKEPARDPDPYVEFSEGMETLLSDLKGRGIPAVVLGQPVLWKEGMSEQEAGVRWFYVDTTAGPVRPSMAWAVSEMRRYNERQRQLAEKYGAVYVPLDEQLPKDLETFFDDCHFTDAGNRHVAEVVLPYLEPVVARLLEQRASSGGS